MAESRLCSIDGCGKPVRARDWCSTHYWRWHRTGDPTKIVRPFVDGVTPCRAPDCAIAARLRGYCSKHYERMRRTNRLDTSRTPPGSTATFIDNVALTFEGDECLVWPFARDHEGYGKAFYGGKRRKASRIVCELANGAAPKDLEAAHTCGYSSCVNPRHLRWATPQENTDDKRRHGTIPRGEGHPNSKLTNEQAKQIFSLYGSRPSSEIAAQFGVSLGTVYVIGERIYWRQATEG